MTNPISFVFSSAFVLIAHAAMLLNVYFSGQFTDVKDFAILAGAVVAMDIVVTILMLTFGQHAHTADFILLLILGASVIFQSCFGGVSFAKKHFITCIAALASCRVGYLLCRDYKWLQTKKKFIWAAIGIMMIVILTLTGSRSMWIDLGFMTIQPSEFIKPLLILACATSIQEQQNKHKILKFDIVYENLILFGIVAAVCLLQWWCRDLGSIPTFAAIYASGFLLRICYPKAKFSTKTLIFAGAAVAAAAVVGVLFAPAYVKERLFADIWNDTSGSGYQQTQALIAVADGGWFGKGPGKGDLCNIFAHESDIVFATISEEWGLLFAVMTVLMLLLLVAIPLVNPPRSYFHGTMCAGVCAAFTVQMALNIFGSCNLIPFTGVTLPFIAEGGSSMATSGFMAGMIVAAQSPVIKKIKPKKSARSAGPKQKKGGKAA